MVTDISKITALAGPQEVQLSGWDGEEITVKLRRPSLYAMAAEGSIPNPLLGVADGLFMGNRETIQQASLDETARTLRAMAKAALVEPTWSALAEAGVELTDQQINEIYAFIVGGAAQLQRFRGKMRDSVGGDEQPHELPGV